MKDDISTMTRRNGNEFGGKGGQHGNGFMLIKDVQGEDPPSIVITSDATLKN